MKKKHLNVLSQEDTKAIVTVAEVQTKHQKAD